MELLFNHQATSLGIQYGFVSILVLMELLFNLGFLAYPEVSYGVSILVLMELLFNPAVRLALQALSPGFNPCFNGTAV